MQSVSHSEQLVDVWCKDLRTIRLGFGCFTDARKLVPTVIPPYVARSQGSSACSLPRDC